MLLLPMLVEVRREIPKCGCARFAVFKEPRPILRRIILPAFYWHWGSAMRPPHLSILSRNHIDECIGPRGRKDYVMNHGVLWNRLFQNFRGGRIGIGVSA